MNSSERPSPSTASPAPTSRYEFMQRVAVGDAAAQAEFVALVERRVRSVAMAILGHVEDAEDATQTALMELLRSARTYRGEGLFAWTDRIAARTAARHARGRRVRAAQREESVSAEDIATWPNANAEHSIPQPLLAYLDEVPEARRTVLVMRHVLEYSVKEIAELTETPENTVKDRLLQAREQLRRRLRRDLALGLNPEKSR